MLVNWIKLEFEQYGHLDSQGNLFLPLDKAEEFLRTCFQHKIAVVGVDFIYRAEDDNFYHLHSLDCSEIIWSFDDWNYLVEYCSQVVWKVIGSEGKKQGIEYFIPSIMEEYDWLMKKMSNDKEALGDSSSSLLEDNG